LLGLVLSIAAIAIGIYSWRSRSLSNANLLKRLPSSDAVVVFVDVDALRRAGALKTLDGSKTGQEPDYKNFVASTGFNYVRDLDTAMVAFAPTGRYLLLRGRFDWKKLQSYVESQHGRCANSVCRMVGSTPERHISFFPLQPNVMAMGVSTDDFAAQRLATPGAGSDNPMPGAPVWVSLPPSVLRSNESLPEGTKMFAHSIDNADSVILGLEPEGARMALKLDVLCRDEKDAAEVASQLARITSVLREMIQREHQTPNAGDLSGVLTSGSFRANGRRVYGYWPIERKFVDNMLGGS
jgi:hypothetical protein